MKPSRANVLVTGGAGFIGFNLVLKYKRLGANVAIFDDFSSSIDRRFLKGSSGKDVKIITGDIRNFRDLEKACKDADVIFHLAANTSVRISWQQPQHDLLTNVAGTINVLLNAAERGIPVVFTSSMGVYGPLVKSAMDEGHPTNPISPYGMSKLLAEKYCGLYSKEGLDITIFRIFNTYGPFATKYVVFDLLRKLENDSFDLQVIGDGNQEKDFVYVEDVVASLVRGYEKIRGLQLYNLGTGTATKISELVSIILRILSLEGKTKVRYTGKTWKGDITKGRANIIKIKKKLRWHPKVTLEEGLKRTIEWFKGRYLTLS